MAYGGVGRLCCNGIAKAHEAVKDQSKPDMFIAKIEPGSFPPLEQFVPYRGTDCHDSFQREPKSFDTRHMEGLRTQQSSDNSFGVEKMVSTEQILSIGRQISSAAEQDLHQALCDGFNQLFNWPHKTGAKQIFDGENYSDPFPVVVYTDSKQGQDDSILPADNAAAVIDAVAELNLENFEQAYRRISVAKRLRKTPAPACLGEAISTNILGIVFCQTTQLPLESFLTDLSRLNEETPSQFWPDMLVFADAGVINYAVQFPTGSISGDHLPPAPNRDRKPSPPMYVVTVLRPVLNYAFAKMFMFLSSHLSLFSPGTIPLNFKDVLDKMPNGAIAHFSYQFNLAGDLVPVSRHFYSDRYLRSPPWEIKHVRGKLLATIEFLPWQDGGVLLLRGKLPLNALMVYLDKTTLTTSLLIPLPSDVQLSYILPLSMRQFIDFLGNIRRNSGMVVTQNDSKRIVQKFSDEGSSSSFVSRLMIGLFRVREMVGFSSQDCQSFDKKYELILKSVSNARDNAKEIENLWVSHERNIQSGKYEKLGGRILEIDENIDRKLQKLTENFISTEVRTLKYGLQNLSKFLGTEIGFWFRKQQAFDKAISQLSNTDPKLAAYLIAARSAWTQLLVTRRNSIEHEGWTLGRIDYREETDTLMVIEPSVDGMPVREYTDFMLDRLCCAIEDITVHLLNRKMPEGTILSEIPFDQRSIEIPGRFCVTTVVHGKTPWRLKYSDMRFDHT